MPSVEVENGEGYDLEVALKLKGVENEEVVDWVRQLFFKVLDDKRINGELVDVKTKAIRLSLEPLVHLKLIDGPSEEVVITRVVDFLLEEVPECFQDYLFERLANSEKYPMLPWVRGLLEEVASRDAINGDDSIKELYQEISSNGVS